MRRSGPGAVGAYEPSAGFTVRPLAGQHELDAYVDLHRSVFESKTMTVPWRMRTLNHPAYRADLDLVVEAPDGRLATFCIGWLDKGSMRGQIEPLGCHRDFRQYALGRVSLSEVLQCIHALGVKDIVVETDSYRNTAFRLYELLEFNVIRDVLVYRQITALHSAFAVPGSDTSFLHPSTEPGTHRSMNILNQLCC